MREIKNWTIVLLSLSAFLYACSELVPPAKQPAQVQSNENKEPAVEHDDKKIAAVSTENSVSDGDSAMKVSIPSVANDLDRAKKVDSSAQILTGVPKKNKGLLHFNDLKKLLPEKASGLGNRGVSGETRSENGKKFSTIEAEYGRSFIKISITDAGEIATSSADLVTWLRSDIEKETDDEYEKTMMVKGFKGYEKYNKTNKKGELVVVIYNRFLVKIIGEGVSAESIREAIDNIDLASLPSMVAEN